MKGYIDQEKRPEGLWCCRVSPRQYCQHPILKNVQKNYKVTYDSSLKTSFIVDKADGMNHEFAPCKKWLFFSDIKSDTSHVLVNTIDCIRSKYTVKQYADSHKACLIQNTLGHPSTNDYIN